MSHELHNFRIKKWSDTANDITDSRFALFNCDAMSRANSVEGHDAYAVDINGSSYLAYKRNASLVIGSISLADQVALLTNADRVGSEIGARGVQVVAMNTLNAADDVQALPEALRNGCRLRYEFTVDVTAYALSRISSNHKRNVKKSIKAGVTVSSPDSREAVLDHLAIVNENLEGKGVGGVSGSPEYFLSLIGSGAGKLFQARSESELLGSTFLFLNPGCAYYHSSGTTKSGRDIGVAHHIVHGALEFLSSSGVGLLNMAGATPDQQGLIRFKMGFRPDVNLLAAGRLQLGSSTRRKLRSILSSGPADFVRLEKTAVFSRSIPSLAGQDSKHQNEQGRIERLEFAALVSLVRGTPALGRSLEQLCHTGDDCYGYYGPDGKLLALLFSDTEQTNTLDITYVEPAAKEMPLAAWETCLRLLAEQAGVPVGQELVVRATPQEQNKREFALAAGFACAGDEKKWTSPLVAGVVNGFR